MLALLGRPAPRVLWYLDEMIIDDSSAVSRVSNGTYVGSIVENELIITRLTRKYYNSVSTPSLAMSLKKKLIETVVINLN